MSINIDTKALGFDFEEEALLVESALRRKELERQKLKVTETTFLLRKKLLQEHFLRMSSVRKHELIIKLMDNQNSTDNVTHIMHFLPLGLEKEDNYAIAEPDVDVLCEKPIFDHDRMLDQKTLELATANDMEWFRSLSNVKQIIVVTELLRRCGSYVRRMLMKPLFEIYFQRLRSKKRPECSIVSLSRKVQIRSLESIIENLDEDVDLDLEEAYDPDHPASIEVEKLRKKRNDIVAKYKKEVEAAERKVASMLQGDDKKEVVAKKGAKAKGSKRSSKSGKDKKQEEELDKIQDLPLWIVKKIFGYLDMKTLKKMKSVNSYWAYIIQDLLVDMKMRKKLDKAIEKLKSQIDPEKLDLALSTVEPFPEESKPWRSKRMKQVDECGVVVKDLVPKDLDEMVQKSLSVDIKNQIYMEQEYLTVINKPILIFPRKIKDDSLYKYTPCILRDVNVALGLQDGSEKQVSFLTYTLSSMMTSSSHSIDFDIELDEKSLLEW